MKKKKKKKKKNGFTLKRKNKKQTITDSDNVDNLALLANAPAPTESLLHSLEQPAKGICLWVNPDKIVRVF